MIAVRPLLSILTLALTACASHAALGPGTRPPPAHPYVAPPGAKHAGLSFADMESGAILRAALRYPKLVAAEEAPPMSLTASDGTGLALERLEAHGVVDGVLAFTELRLRFKNPHARVIEGRFAITLPQGAAISRLAMRLDHGWQEAEVVERQLARRAYEDFLHRRQDPALLEKEAGNEFRARIFPIPANGSKDIILSYSQELTSAEDAYVLPLKGLPEVRELDVLVHSVERSGGKVTRKKHELSRRRAKPDRDFTVKPSGGVSALANGDLVVARIRPKLGAATAPMASIAILFDTSASRALGFSRAVKKLGEVVAELRSLHGDDVGLSVLAFDQTVTAVYDGALGGFGSRHLDAVRARRPLGASNLAAALDVVAKRGAERVVVMSDGIATAGSAGGDELRAAAKRLGKHTRRFDAVVTGGIRDEQSMRRLTQGALAADGIVISGDLPATVIARRLSQTTLSGIEVKVAGAEWVWPETLDGVQPGDEVLVYADLERALPAGKPLGVELAGPIQQKLTATPAPTSGPLLERSIGKAEIERLSFQRDQLDPKKKSERARLKKDIVDLSTRLRVLSDHTALLVLESEADYARFGIDRRALSDIVTIGKRGIETLSRKKPVLLVPEAPAEPVTSKAPAAAKPSQRPSAYPTTSPPGDPLSADLPVKGQLELRKEKKEDAYGGVVAERPLAQPPAAPPPPPPSPSPEPPSVEPSDAVARAAPSGGSAPPAPSYDREMDADEEEAPGEARVAGGEQERPTGPPPYSGRMAKVMGWIAQGRIEAAIVDALAWRNEDAGDVMALVALGEALEARGAKNLAARAYGSIVDLFPSRADMRRFAANRLERLGRPGRDLAADAYAKAVEQRPDHLTGHRLLAYALLRAGKHAAAFAAIEKGLSRRYPGGRFEGGRRILQEDLGILAAAWLAKEPNRRAELVKRLAAHRASVATKPSLRFVLSWETDANDVDFHIYDARGGHAFYEQKALPSGGALYADVTTGYGPECFAIEGRPTAFPYEVRLHYYSRGPMGYGMGKLEIVRHDGKGNLRFEQRPFVVMNDGAYVELGQVHAK